MIVEVLGILRALLDLATVKRDAWRKLGRLIVQPFITAVILSLFYCGFFVVRERNISTGLRIAFLDSRATILNRERDIQIALLQAELRQSAESEVLISQQLRSLLEKSPGAARVRLGVIHNGVTGLTGINLLKFDITNAVARPGRTAGELVRDEPLGGWSGFLGKLLTGDCATYRVSDLGHSPGRERLEQMGAAGILACPIVDVRSQMLGALFLHWDTGDEVPRGEALDAVTAAAKSAGLSLAYALDLKAVRQ